MYQKANKKYTVIKKSDKSIIVILMATMAIVDTLGVSLLIKILLDYNTAGPDKNYIIEIINISLGINQAALVVVLLIIIKAFLKFYVASKVVKKRADVIKNLRNGIYKLYKESKYDYFSIKKGAESLNMLTEQIFKFGEAYHYSLQMNAELVAAVTYLIFAAYIDLAITITLSIIGLAVLLLYKPIKGITKNISNQNVKHINNYSVFVNDMINNIKYFVATKNFDRTSNKYHELVKNINENEIKTGKISALSSSLSEPIIISAIGLIFISNIASENFVSLAASLFLIYRSMGYIMRFYVSQNLYAKYSGSVKILESNINELVDYRRIDKKLSKNEIPNKIKNIELEDISYKYRKTSILALEKLSAKFYANKLNVIVGKSGAGKTTLVDILLGIKSAESGNIKFNGKKITKEALNNFAENIGYVTQGCNVFSGSLFYNLNMSEDVNIPNSVLVKTLEEVGLRDWYETLKYGLDTIIGDGQHMISGGQVQRIALARELIKRPKIMFLDEITSGLDSETEKDILNLIHSIKNDVLIIMIAHKERVINSADHLVRLK